MIYPPPPHLHVLGSGPGRSPFPTANQGRKESVPRGASAGVAETREQATAQLCPGTAVGGKAYLAAQHRVSSVFAPKGCSAPVFPDKGDSC